MKKDEIKVALEALDTRLFLILQYLEVIVQQTTKLEEDLVETRNKELKRLEEDYKRATEETGL